MKEAVFSYRQIDQFSTMPIIPMRLEHDLTVIDVEALIDSGSAVNVMPYQIGLDLGFDWAACPAGGALTGNLSVPETRLLVVQALIADLKKIQLGFVWVNSDRPRLLLGQNNFFKHYNICFSRTNLKIQISEEISE